MVRLNSLSVLRRSVRPRAAAMAAAVCLVGTAAAVTAPAAGASTPTYVALGDSYTSGPLIPNQQLNPPGCLRSDHNYPHDSAAVLGLLLTDVSCSGATTADMTTPQSTSLGTNPPQLDALSPSTSVVSLGIAGNDINFSGIIENCAALTPWGPTKVGTTCKSYYDPGGNDQLAAAINALGPKVGAVLAQIHQRSSGAQVFVEGYPAILPPTGTGCWPQMPLTVTDVPYLRSVEIGLNAMLAREAAANNATFVDTYSGSTAHNACTLETVRWVEPVVPNSPAYPVHPNLVGEAALAGFLIPAIRAAGIT